MSKIYEVECKCGHVGRHYYTLKIFAIKAENGKEAASIARQLPRVKHDHKDAIRSVREIDITRSNEIYLMNLSDPYFTFKCIQDQRRSECEIETYSEYEDCYDYDDEEEIGRTVYYKKAKVRNPKRYFNNYISDMECCW